MCYCCPQAVSALFCLLARSGFSKASVAGALMFFPPEPSLYVFKRLDRDGNPIEDDDDQSTDDEREENGESNDTNKRSKKKGKKKKYTLSPTSESGSQDVNASQDSGGALVADNTDYKSGKTGKKPKSSSKNNPSKAASSAENAAEDADYGQYYDDDFQEMNLAERAAKLRRRGQTRNKKDARDARRGVTYRFHADARLMSPPPFSGTIEAVKIGPDPKTQTYIATLVYKLRAAKQTEDTMTLIYSHGNATDIGAMNFMQAVLAKGLQMNVVMYDYSGYGASGGEPLEDNTYRDIKMVYEYVKNNLVRDKDESKIVLYGQSVGSGPSCYLASKRPNLGGMILHSPFMSGMRVLTPSRILGCLDVFPNIDRIKKVKCPVMIIHGELDEEVPIHHGKALHDAVQNESKRPPWWVPGRGHNDLTDGRQNLIEYIDRVTRFMESLH